MNLRHLLVSGKIDAREALAIVPLHRDIKPENILLGKNGGGSKPLTTPEM